MLEVQKYLLFGKSLEDLNTELGITNVKHDSLPLVILNYSQIDSPKTHPIVRECRGLVLNSSDFSLVAKSFNRFYNWGENQEEMNLFNFDNFYTQTKEDGSLIILYNFQNKWRMNTRGSFAQFQMDHQDFTWEQGFCKALNVSSLQDLDEKLDPSLTYICELCSPWNKVVRRYPNPIVFLLTIFRGELEFPPQETDNWKEVCNWKRPQIHNFHSIEEIKSFLTTKTEEDPTFEGVVIQDNEYTRYKIKSPTYLSLHQLKGNNNVFNPKNLIPFILSNEADELLTYFPEVTDTFNELKQKVDSSFKHLELLWEESHKIQSQKDFALKIIKRTKFSSILFQLRKEHGENQTNQLLRKYWINNPDLIIKILLG